MYYYIKGKFGDGDDCLDDHQFDSDNAFCIIVFDSDNAFRIIEALEKLGIYDLSIRTMYEEVKFDRSYVENYLIHRGSRSDSNMTYNERIRKEFGNDNKY